MCVCEEEVCVCEEEEEVCDSLFVCVVATVTALSQFMKNGQVDENRTTTLPESLRRVTSRSTTHLTYIRTEFLRLDVDLVGVCVE